MTLRAIVIGTGWAGEGHTIALRAVGVDVIAICGRTPEPARARAAQLGIDDVRLDWQQAITDLHPDLVSIATTAAPHREMVVTALTPAQLDEIPDAADPSNRDGLAYPGWSRGEILVHLAMMHNYGHSYEVCTICSLLGISFWE
jgi:hypothetical protein